MDGNPHGQNQLLSGHRRGGAGAQHLPSAAVRRHHRAQRRDHLHRLQRRPPGAAQLLRPGPLHREILKIPSGERYELCRSVHAEANAIISASRRDMLGATLYLVGRDAKTGEFLTDTTFCSMCRRQIINAGIETVVTRIGRDGYEIVPVSRWIENDDTLGTEA